ncbi:Hypothetical_protein [Hexamita inflata]|uniref:Hypothetical_protein n=1 Tax=Hexamita inflata TaxID=28002 RepID=A0AA86QB81_9EUKA|nr:Hypothetical protein HINF_LOCUS42463 [Hexamita inflata]
MGRPFKIRENEFSEALRQFLRDHTQPPLDTDLQLYVAFKAFPKLLRPQLWQQLAVSLDKTSVQVKNYFFNTWAERINASITDSEQQSQPSELKDLLGSFQQDQIPNNIMNYSVQNTVQDIEQKVFFASSNQAFQEQCSLAELFSRFPNQNEPVAPEAPSIQKFVPKKPEPKEESVSEPFFSLFDE